MKQQGLEAEVLLLRNENCALQQLLEVHENTLALESKRLEDALKLLSQEQRSLYARIQQETNFDSLTGLPNRSTFSKHLDRALQSVRTNLDHRFAVLSIDVDRFQLVNESLGHLAGNQLLQDIAQRLVSILRTTDLVSRIGEDPRLARLGGDEFAVLLDDVQRIGDATHICDRIQQNLAAPFFIEGREFFITVSIGVALSATAYQFPDEVLRDADMAMRRAKQLGKARSQVFNAEMRASALVRWELETDLRHALKRNELRVYYQPKVDAFTRTIVGFEALVRWEHPTKGLISPLQFIPIAEETGLILPIGNWVLREACRQLKQWNDEYQNPDPLVISVNLSCCQFADATLFEKVADALKDTGLSPDCLWLEITESNLMGNMDFAIEVLNKLKTLGVGLMIDDFGTGYSSLNHLAKFPFDTLKIDQSFVRAMDKNADGTQMVRTVIGLAHNLNLDVVAEGIETESQLGILQALGCPYGQGYLFSKPIDAAAMHQLLNKLEHAKSSDATLAA